MSSFIIYRKKEYAVILVDHLGHRKFPEGNVAPLIASKLTQVGSGVFAAHAGTWQPCYDILTRLHEFLICTPTLRSYDDIMAFLSDIGKERHEYYKSIYKSNSVDMRIPIVLTGHYRRPQDIENEVSSTCLVYETANNFTPTPAIMAFYAYNSEVTNVIGALLELPALNLMLNSGPLSLVQALDAIHSLIAKICVYVSPEVSIVIVGDGEEFTVVKGFMTTLPCNALRFG